MKSNENSTTTTFSAAKSSQIAAVLLALVTIVGFPASVIAGRAPSGKHSPDVSTSSFKQESEPSTPVHMTGILTCVAADSARSPAAAQDCILKFQETQTGKLFQLSQAESLMELYQAGTRKITIGGVLSGESSKNPTIQVKETTTSN